jgi:hypothetical protein
MCGYFRSRDEGRSLAAKASAGYLAVPLLLTGLAFLVKALYPVDLPVQASPGFIETVFANRLVVWAARLLLVSAAAVLAFGGVFIAVSIGIRMKSGHWLRRAGPFEISERAVDEVEGQLEFWRDAALESRIEISRLEEQLRRSDRLVRISGGSGLAGVKDPAPP